MNIYEFANIKMATKGYTDLTTGENLNWHQYMTRVVNKLGFEEVKKCIPFTLEEIKKALPKDEYLNNLAMKKWDNASGIWVNDRTGDRGILHGAPLLQIYRKHGIDSFSQSNGVSILKTAARMWVEQEGE